jgi:hypothetical protein
MSLLNETNPELISLPEADVSDMEYFITQVQIVLPVLGVNLFRGKSLPRSSAEAEVPSPPDSPVFTMNVPKGGIARAQEIDGEFTVLSGSRARTQWVSKPGTSRAYRNRDMREALIAKGVLVDADGLLIFVRDQVFSSPSAAAAVIVGTDTHNGRRSWKVEASGVSYGDWQALRISEAPAISSASSAPAKPA